MAKNLQQIIDTKTQLFVTEIISLRSYITLASAGYIKNVSLDGCLISIYRKDLLINKLKFGLNINCLVGEPLTIYLPQMNLDLEGEVTSTKHIGGGVYEVFLNFPDTLPHYWKECLLDLLPNKKELIDLC